MLISCANSLVLFAVPKTGTMALEFAFARDCDLRLTGAPEQRHVTMRTYAAQLEPKVRAQSPAEPELIALVRAPLDWLASWYRYRARDGMKHPEKSTREMSFEAFIEAYLSGEPPPPARIGSQAAFLARADGRCGATTLFPYERFAEAEAYLRRRLGSRAEVQAANVSAARPLILSPALHARLRAERAADFALHQQAVAGWEALAARIRS